MVRIRGSGLLGKISGLAVLFLAHSLAAAQSLSDGSFELPSLATNAYVAASGGTIAGSPWTFSTNTGSSRGIASNGSAYTAQTGPTSDGKQVVYLQGDGTVAQTFSVPTTGHYQVSLKAVLRHENTNLNGMTLGIEVDGVSRWSQPTIGTVYTAYATPTITLGAGSHTLTLRGTNNFAGQDNTVFVDAVSISAVANPPPTVSVSVTPSTGLLAPATVTLSASASDSDGIARVEFYGDGLLLGSDTTAAYSWSWSNIPAGSHTAKAIAYDTLGASTVSTIQTFAVTAQGNVADGSFELPSLATNAYVAASGGAIAGSPWTFSTNTGSSRGIASNGSAYTAQTGPTSDGKQVAYLQGDGTVSQAVSVATAGSYAVSLKAVLRKENTNPSGVTLGIEVDGVSRYSQSSVGTVYTAYSTPTFPLTAGIHTITIRGTNKFPGQDNTVFVDAVALTSGNAAPSVTLAVSPNTGLLAPATVSLNATANDTDGTIARVDFYGDGAFLGSDTTLAYSWSWANIPAGAHTAKAVAVDNLGASTTSTVQAFSVTAQGNVADGSFELPSLAINAYLASSGGVIGGSPWTFAPGTGSAAGIASNGSAYTAQTGPTSDGKQVAYLQGNATVSQVVNLAAGNYQVSLKAALRKENTNLNGVTLGIEVDGVSRYSQPTVGTTYTPYSTPAFTLTAGNHTITVRGTNNFAGSDNTVFVDVVNVAPASNPAPVVTVTVTPSTGLIAPASVTVNATASDSDGIARVEFYGDGAFLGSDTTNPYSWAWTNIAAGAHVAKATAFDNLGASTTATQAFSVDAPPSVTLAVTPNTGLIAPATVALNATAADSDGTIARVDFYGDGTLLGSDTTSPYSWSWAAIAAGTHNAKAVAFDNLGASTTSAIQTFSVTAQGNVTDGSFELPSLAAGAYIASVGGVIAGSPWTFAPGAGSAAGIASNGSLYTSQTGPTSDGKQVAYIQGDGTISQTVNLSAGTYKVSVKAVLRKENTNPGGSKLGIEVDGISRWSTTPPPGTTYLTYTTFTFTLPAGNHTITVRGTNNFPGQDNTLFIDAVSVTSTVNPPPTVTISYSSPSLVAPATVTLTATANDSDGIARVDFVGDSQSLGTDISSPYVSIWSGLAAGTHTATAQAYDTLGATTVSAPVSFTVTPAPPTTYFGYFGDCATCTAETVDHTNLIFIGAGGDHATAQGLIDINNRILARLIEAKAAGITTAIVAVDHAVFIGTGSDPLKQDRPQVPRATAVAQANLRALFNLLRTNPQNNNVLGMVTAIYTIDEPDGNLGNPDDVVAANSLIRGVASEYAELSAVKLAVIYSENFHFNGISSFDWVGFDAYRNDDIMFYPGGPYDTFTNYVGPSQRILIVPGGASSTDVHKTDPVPFYNKMVEDPRIIAMIPFLWQTVDGPPPEFPICGIKDDGMAPAYRAVGLLITGKPSKARVVANVVSGCPSGGVGVVDTQ